jgi:hypothetical protein
MKNLVITLVVLSLLFSSSLLCAQATEKESFYQACIDQAIDKYERKSLKVDSDRPALRRDAAVATLKTSFYKSHKEQLINQMVAQDFGTKSGEMNYFLVKSFGNFLGQNLDQAIAEILETNDEKLQKESYEAYSQEKQ